VCTNGVMFCVCDGSDRLFFVIDVRPSVRPPTVLFGCWGLVPSGCQWPKNFRFGLWFLLKPSNLCSRLYAVYFWETVVNIFCVAKLATSRWVLGLTEFGSWVKRRRRSKAQRNSPPWTPNYCKSSTPDLRRCCTSTSNYWLGFEQNLGFPKEEWWHLKKTMELTSHIPVFNYLNH